MPEFIRAQPRSLSLKSFRFLALVVIYLLIVYALPLPNGMSHQGLRITGIFFATICGLMLQPMPGSQVVLIGVSAMVLVAGVPIGQALSGYSAPSVWMVFAAMLMSRALRDSGLARRIALLFVRMIGRTVLGLGYALHLTEK